MLDLRQPSPPKSPAAHHRCHRDTLHHSFDSTATQQCTRESTRHARDRLPKPQSRPKLYSMHHHIFAKMPAAPPSEASQQPHRQAAIHQSPSCSRLRDDAPKKEKDAVAPPSFNSEDLRFPSGARPRDRGEEHSAALPRKSMAPAGVTVAGSCCYYCCLIQHVHFWIRIICSYWCRIYFHLN
jgi:hypothetical protein